ncbi:unnamed protein product [Durusdinium trenchii]|uniref:Uncharacterized protein n=1 Tax=Durusdinium trenchii TaxID=1381693 RepID=A0ABP0P1H7_9DINO
MSEETASTSLQIPAMNVNMKQLTAKLVQATCQGDAVQEARVKVVAEGQSLQAAWQGDTFQALVKLLAEGQSLQAAWQGDTFQALVELPAEGQSLQAAWQGCLARRHLPSSG